MTTILLIIAVAQGVVIALILGAMDRLKKRIGQFDAGLQANRDRLRKLEGDVVPILENHKTGTMLLRLRERANQ